MWLSSTKSNTGFRFAVVVARVAGAKDSFAPEDLPGENPALIGKYSPRKCGSSGWNDDSGETLNNFWGEARPAFGVPRGDK